MSRHYESVTIPAHYRESLGVLAEAHESDVDTAAGDAVWRYIVDQVLFAYLILKCSTNPKSTVGDAEVQRAQRLVDAVPLLDIGIRNYVQREAIRKGYMVEETKVGEGM